MYTKSWNEVFDSAFSQDRSQTIALFNCRDIKNTYVIISFIKIVIFYQEAMNAQRSLVYSSCLQPTLKASYIADVATSTTKHLKTRITIDTLSIIVVYKYCIKPYYNLRIIHNLLSSYCHFYMQLVTYAPASLSS